MVSMTRVTVQEAELHLSALIDDTRSGEEIVITRDTEPVARLVPVARARRRTRRGTGRGLVLHIAPDFDAPLECMREYMR